MRVKIVAGNLVAVLFVGLVSYAVLRSKLEDSLANHVDANVENSRILFERSWMLSGVKFLEQVREQAESRKIRQVFTGLDQESRRKRAFSAIEALERWFADPARGRGGGPDVVVMTDEKGRVIARNKDINRMYDEMLQTQLPSLSSALSGVEALSDVWYKPDEQKIFQTAIVPILGDTGNVIGAVVVGYDISNGFAKRESKLLGFDIAFVVPDKVYSSSLDTERVGALRDQLLVKEKKRTQAVFANQHFETSLWEANLAGHNYVGVLAPLPMSGSFDIAYAVMGDRTEALEPVNSTNILLILSVLGVIFVVAYGMMLGSSFLKPIENIEAGLLMVINGKTDHRLDIESDELGGLAYRINQLINMFTGVNEEDEEGRVSRPPLAPAAPAWGDKTMGEEREDPKMEESQSDEPIDDPVLANILEKEPEQDYYRRLYQEYIQAKRNIGEEVSQILYENFVRRLKGNETSLEKRHNCRMVRYQVESTSEQVVLRPVIIR